MRSGYMEEIKYHPLVDMDTNGKIKRAMFASTNKEQMKHHSFWLEEMVHGSFRLFSRDEMPGKELGDIEVYCPNCGKVLKPISDQNDGNRHAIYICTNCR